MSSPAKCELPQIPSSHGIVRGKILGGDGSRQGRWRHGSVISDFSGDSLTYGTTRCRRHGVRDRGSRHLSSGSKRGCSNSGQLRWAMDGEMQVSGHTVPRATVPYRFRVGRQEGSKPQRIAVLEAVALSIFQALSGRGQHFVEARVATQLFQHGRLFGKCQPVKADHAQVVRRGHAEG